MRDEWRITNFKCRITNVELRMWNYDRLRYASAIKNVELRMSNDK